MEYQDFGEKIGGARKDVWSSRGLYAYDLEAMNEREADTYVRKDNVWKKPDYQKMIADGMPVDVAYFRKTIRDSLSATPQYYRTDDTQGKKTARQREYIDTIREIQGKTEKIFTRYDALTAFDDILIQGGYVQMESRGSRWVTLSATEKGNDNAVITNHLVNVLYLHSEQDYERKVVHEAARKQFGVTKERKSAAAPSRGKKKFCPPQLQHIRRTGPNFRCGYNVSSQDYLDAFGFKGGEFGNWMNQEDRRVSMNMGYEALKDLAAVLKISEKDISYQGTLSIAFGSRGRGNAAAHYEPLRKVINLTKMHGAGSLAHEWWHGLDDYLGTYFGSKEFLSEQPNLYEPFQRLLEVIMYKEESMEQAEARAEARYQITVKNAADCLDSQMLYYLNKSDDPDIQNTYQALRSEFLSGTPDAVEKLNLFRKKISGHIIPKKGRDTLEFYSEMLAKAKDKKDIKPCRKRTDFYTNSVRMDRECQKDGGYWSSKIELTARAFACYVKDRLPYISDYLCGHADSARTTVVEKNGTIKDIMAFPEGDERREINAAFDQLFFDLKERGILTHSEYPQPLEKSSQRSMSMTVEIPDVRHVKQMSLFEMGLRV